MASVDDRVVSMKFDNKDFESKISGTLGSLAKLKASLDFGDSTKNINNLSAAAKGFSLHDMGMAIENISSKFSAMGAVGFTVISHLTTTALEAGTQFVKAFSIDPITDGFHEFETNMGSIQTIMANTASKGTTLDQVSEALDKLNVYSDQTIYNFGEMAKNIGTFTAAGVDLDKSVLAIKGIANLAALSGSTSDQASSAMYQLSQAMASGTVKAQDWISVVNSGMGGEVFQNALFQTAVALKKLNVPMGTTFAQWKAMGGNFKDAMADGIITADVLSLTLQGFTGDLDAATLVSKGYTQTQADAIVKTAEVAKAAATEVKTFSQLTSTLKEAIGTGWADTFKIIIGGFDESKQLFTGLSTIFGGLIGRISTGRNTMLQAWKDLGGREAIIQSLRNVMWSLATVISTVHKAFRDAFPKKTGEDLAGYSKAFERLTHALIPSENTLKILGGLFGIIFSTLSIGGNIIYQVVKGFVSLFKIIGKGLGIVGGASSDGLAGFFSLIAEKLTVFKNALADGGAIADFFSKIGMAISDFISRSDISGKVASIMDWLRSAKDAVASFVGSIDFSGKWVALVDWFGQLRDAIVDMYIRSIAPALQPFMNGMGSFKKLLSDINAQGGVIDFVTRLKDAFLGFFGRKAVTPGIDAMGAATGRVTDRFHSFMAIGEKLGGVISWIGQQFSNIAEFVKGLIPKIIDGLKSGDFSGVHDALNVGLFATILALINKFLNNGIRIDLFGGLANKFGKVVNELTSTLKAFQAEIKAEAIMKIAKALVLMTLSLLVLSLIDSAALTKALAATAAGFAELAVTLKTISKAGGENLQDAGKLDLLAAGLILLSFAILVLAASVKIFSSMDNGDLARGLIGVGVLLAEVSASVKLMDSPKRMAQLGVGLYIIARAIGKLVSSVETFSKMDPKDMLRGLAGVGIALTLLVVAVKNIPENAEVKGAGIAIIALSLLVLSKAVDLFSQMDPIKMAQGLIGIAVSLGILVAAMRFMDSPKRALEAAGSIAILSLSLIALAKAVDMFGQMDSDKMNQGLFGIAGAMLILIASSHLINDKDNIKAAASIVILAGSIIVMAAAVKAFSDIGFVNAMLALAALVIIIGVIAAGAYLLNTTGAIAAIAALGAALLELGFAVALIGVGVLAFGIGLIAFVGALKMMADVGVPSIKAIIAVLPELATSVGAAIAAMVIAFLEKTPDVLKALGTFIGAMKDFIIENAPKIAETFGAIVSAISSFLDDHGQQLFDIGMKLFTIFLTGIDNNIEEISTKASSILVKFINTMTTNLPQIQAAGAHFIVTFIDGIIKNIDPIANAVQRLIITFLNSIAQRIRSIMESGRNLIFKFIDGLIDAIPGVVRAVVRLVTTWMDALGNQENVKKLATSAGDMVINILKGLRTAIDEKAPEIRSAALGLVQAIVDGMTGGFISKTQEVVTAATNFGSEALSAISKVFNVHSPSKETYKIAGFVAEGFSHGLRDDTIAEASAETFANNIVGKLNATIAEVSGIMENSGDFNPRVTPVLDLTEVTSGAAKISGLMGNPNLNASVSFGQAGAIALATKTGNDQVEVSGVGSPSGNIVFEQNIHAPTQLTASEIYRQTKSQFALATKELKV